MDRVLTNGRGAGNYTYSLTLTREMAPKSVIIATLVFNNELIGDMLELNIDGLFSNKVSTIYPQSKDSLVITDIFGYKSYSYIHNELN